MRAALYWGLAAGLWVSGVQSAWAQVVPAPEAPPAGEAEPAADAAPAAGQDAPATGAAAQPGHVRDPHTALAAPSLPTAEPAGDLPIGSIAIEVLDPRGQPYPNAEIVLGVMASMGARTEQRAKTGADGRYTFSGLATGTQQAYRVNVLYGGAKFSTTPFRLPDDSGYLARVPLLATTQSDRMVFQVIGQTFIELRDDRLHVTQQARLANAGDGVFVLPKEGIVVPLPENFTAFSWQEQMTDQRGDENAGVGFKLRGSLPPGSVTLAWSFDLPRSGESAKIPVSLPFRTFSYRVISEAPEGLSMRVSEFPAVERVQDGGRSLWFTQIQRSPSDARLDKFQIKLDGIPGPGPGRWIASGIALFAVLFGLSRAFRGSSDDVDRRATLEAHKLSLIARAKQTEEEHARGDIGPEYKAERMQEIVTELAMVLRDEEGLGPISKVSAGRS